MGSADFLARTRTDALRARGLRDCHPEDRKVEGVLHCRTASGRGPSATSPRPRRGGVGPFTDARGRDHDTSVQERAVGVERRPGAQCLSRPRPRRGAACSGRGLHGRRRPRSAEVSCISRPAWPRGARSSAEHVHGLRRWPQGCTSEVLRIPAHEPDIKTTNGMLVTLRARATPTPWP